MTEKDYEDIELVTVKLPRKDYENLKRVLEREAAYDWLSRSLKSFWVWTVAGGVLAFVTLYDHIIGIFK